MDKALTTQLEVLLARHEEIARLLSDQEVLSNNEKFIALSKEYAELQPVVDTYTAHQSAQKQIISAEALLSDPDQDMRAMAKSELEEAKINKIKYQEKLEMLLLPKDEKDSCNIYLEIRAGTGGNEASLFVGDLFRMYTKFAETKKWQIETMSFSEGEQGGFKEIIAKISGQNVFGELKFESGAHRVQRVPVTESQGRIHTSACTVAVMPEVESVESVDIDPKDLKIDTYRSSGAGGQHVNTTDSAIRITHLPTGIVVECQDERSQHKNKAKALSLLNAKILDAEVAKQQAEEAETRKQLVGSGDRSERIRTYNFPQGRITDHRINLTLYKLDQVMEGELEQVIHPLLQADQAQKLAELKNQQSH